MLFVDKKVHQCDQTKALKITRWSSKITEKAIFFLDVLPSLLSTRAPYNRFLGHI